MSSLRRFTGIVTAMLVLQLTLLGAAAPCTGVTAGSDPHGTVSTEATAHETHALAPATQPEDCNEHSDPGAPSGGNSPSCIAMISCVTPMLQLGVAAQLSANVVAADEAPSRSLEPPTRNTVPEPPPPRA